VTLCENEPLPAGNTALDGVYAAPLRAETERYRQF
jgi:hypothetical protein